MRAIGSNCVPTCTISSIAAPAPHVRGQPCYKGWSSVAGAGGEGLVQYNKHGPRYVCRDAAIRSAASTCHSFGQRYLDEAVCACFFEAIKPAQLDTLLAALENLEQERQARERGWQLRLERGTGGTGQAGTGICRRPEDHACALDPRGAGSSPPAHASMCPPSGKPKLPRWLIASGCCAPSSRKSP